MTCPDCGSGMMENARACGCGWRRTQQAPKPGLLPVQEERAPISPERREELQRMVREFRRPRERSLFAHWCDCVNEKTVSHLLAQGDDNSKAVLQRFHDAGVLHDDYSIVPKDQRTAVAAERLLHRQKVRAAIEAELEARGIVELPPAPDAFA